jgi:hypothetical protein
MTVSVMAFLPVTFKIRSITKDPWCFVYLQRVDCVLEPLAMFHGL